MKKYTYYLLTTVLLITCCTTQIKEIESININISDDLEGVKNVSDNEVHFMPIQLPDSIFFGEIVHIKQYEEYMFLHDEGQTNTLTIIDNNGKYINQLKNIGDGPGEYRSLNAFSCSYDNKVLTIYDRSKFSLQHYSIPDLKHLETFRIEKHLMNIEYINNDTILVVSENELSNSNDYEGYLYIDSSGKELTQDLSLKRNPATIEISYPNTAIRINNKTYVIEPHEISTLFEMGSLPKPILQIDFESNNIPSKYWNSREAGEFQKSLLEGNKAVWVQNLIYNKNALSFSFLYKDIDTRYFVKQDLENNNTIVYSEYILVDEEKLKVPYPIGSDGNNYISLIYTENINVNHFTNKKLKQAIREAEISSGHIIVKYKP